MPVVVPAVKGQMGSHSYYLTKMSARELVSSSRPASQLEEWGDWGIEERMQRELNMSRVVNELVPYLTNSSDRFFGAFVVLIYQGEVVFEELKKIGADVPAAYRAVASNLGFLTIDGGELIVLDGQHRHAALKAVINSSDEEGPYRAEVPNDEVEVVFLAYDNDKPEESREKVRRVFNKLNRYARPTGRSDNIITSEDDGYAIVTRRLLRTGEPLGVTVKEKKGGKEVTELIVNWKSNTIAQRSLRFTTVSAVYETTKIILAQHGINEEDFGEKKRVVRPSDPDLDLAYEHVHEWWDAVLNGIEVFKEALADPAKLPQLREPGGPYSLLFKPAAHIVLFKALALATDEGLGGLTLEEAIQRANKVDWNLESDLWQQVLIQPGNRISARKEHYEVTAELLAYLLSGDCMSEEEKARVREAVREFRGPDYELPEPAVA